MSNVFVTFDLTTKVADFVAVAVDDLLRDRYHRQLVLG